VPRPPKLKISPDVVAEMALKYHVDQMLYSKSDGVTQVHHVQWGWMPMEDYYKLAKIHDVLPLIEKVVEGGYRMKAALWGIDISFGILGTGTEMPLGLALVAGALGLSAIDTAAGRTDLATLDVLALVLPFGEIYLIVRGAVIFGEAIADSVDTTIANIEFFAEKKEEAITRAKLIDWRKRSFF